MEGKVLEFVRSFVCLFVRSFVGLIVGYSEKFGAPPYPDGRRAVRPYDRTTLPSDLQ